MPLEALVFDVQRFTLHDGPGVRTAAFFKGCALRCQWCQNPESQRPSPELAFYEERCLGCFRCAGVCPAGAILHDASRRIDYALCDGCGRCAEACPAEALRLIGRAWTAPSLAEALLRDRDFFEESGGGATLTGGEPMLCAAFLEELCAILKDRGVHVTLETAGQFDPSSVPGLLGLIDLVYFDLKHCDPIEHLRLTGRDNGLILQNFGRFANGGFRVQPRMPLVPGANDSEGNIRATARLVAGSGLASVHVLPYHALGDSKLRALAPGHPRFAARPPTAEGLERARAIFEEEGVDAVIYA